MWSRWRLVLRILLAKAADPAHGVQTLLKCSEPTIHAAAAHIAAAVGRAPRVILRLGLRTHPANARANSNRNSKSRIAASE
jgi:hypothetical protein